MTYGDSEKVSGWRVGGGSNPRQRGVHRGLAAIVPYMVRFS